jgi:hypothetical protein
MIYVVPFEADDFRRLRVQHDQAWLTKYATVEKLKTLEGPYSGTLMKDGKPIACAGALPYWEGRALVWSFLGDDLSVSDLLRIAREAKRFLTGLPFRRLEASVAKDFVKGHQFIRMLGFDMETPLQKCFQIDGSDTVGYVRIKG